MTACPVCLAQHTRSFFEQRDVPTQEGYLAPTRGEALAATCGEITLRHCHACGHIWNASFDADKLRFDPQYDVSMFHSPAYRRYIDGVINRLIARYDLRNKTALEIACGKGDFLRALIANGIGEAIGFDPTFDDANLSDPDRQHIVAYRAYYDQSHRAMRTDLVACRSALQYFRHPRPFLMSLRETLQEQFDTVVYFELPNGDETFGHRMVWNVAYEHGCFFTATSLARLFGECGFEVLDVMDGLNGSQLEIEARPARSPVPPTIDAAALAATAADVEAFSGEFEARVRQWSTRLTEAQARKRRLVLWGAGARAIGFLNNVPAAAAAIEHVVDINPARQGRFLPKTGQQVVAPEQLRDLRPDLVIATNPNFATEIAAQLASLDIGCEFDVLR